MFWKLLKCVKLRFIFEYIENYYSKIIATNKAFYCVQMFKYSKPNVFLLGGNISEELYHVGQMVLVLGVGGPGVGLEEEVPGGELEGHAGGGPDVCWRAVP